MVFVEGRKLALLIGEILITLYSIKTILIKAMVKRKRFILSKLDKVKITIFVVAFFVTRALLSNWDDFEAGFLSF
ncbi:MAG: hypothetical protein RH805_00255 [Balneola sp.]